MFVPIAHEVIEAEARRVWERDPGSTTRYLLVDRLGGSNRAEVWRATDEVLDRPVAMKVLRPSWRGTDALIPAVCARARTVIGLSHSGIAATYDYGETRVGVDGTPACQSGTGTASRWPTC